MGENCLQAICQLLPRRGLKWLSGLPCQPLAVQRQGEQRLLIVQEVPPLAIGLQPAAGLGQQPGGEPIQPQPVHLLLAAAAVVVGLPLKVLQGLLQPLRLGQLAQGQPFGQLKAGDHMVVELLVVDDGHCQGWQAETGPFPGHAAGGADGEVVPAHQVGHLVALAQQRQVEVGQFGHSLLQLGPERIGPARHQGPADGTGPGQPGQAVEGDEAGTRRVGAAKADKPPLPLTGVLPRQLAIGGAQQGVVGAEQQPAIGGGEGLVIGDAAQGALIQQQLAVVRPVGQIIDHQHAAAVGGQLGFESLVNLVVIEHQPIGLQAGQRAGVI